MKNKLDKHVIAYEGKSIYEYDNKIMLNWYPKRIIDLTCGAHSILEFGLGHGITAQIFSKNYQKHIVLEGSAAVIENYNKKYPNNNTQIIETYFEEYKSNDKFDVIVLGFVLEHVEKPAEILDIAKKYLSADGKLFITVPNAEAMNRRLGNYAGLLKNLHDLSDSDIEQGHKRYYTVDSLTKEVTSANLMISHIEGIYLKPFTTKQILSLKIEDKIVNAMCQLGVEYPELCLGILAQAKVIR